MTDEERAAALAEEIAAAGGLHWASRLFSETRTDPIGDDKEDLIIAALGAYAERPAVSGDVRESVVMAIANKARVKSAEHGAWLENPAACADAVLSVLQSAGWGPREESAAALDVLAERQRQMEAEGWTAEHDDEHSKGEMALAAACYSIWSAKSGKAISSEMNINDVLGYLWQWDDAWFKPTTRRRNLVKAGALILAEIERLDRADKEPPIC